MRIERRQEVERLYEAALERDAAEREAFLDRECRGDEELRREVASLLGYASRADGFIETPALGVAARAAGPAGPRLEPGAHVGPYEVLAPLGAGGMGEVYVARDTRLGRKVALKVLPEDFARDPERVRRFEREARTAGSLDHPNLLAVHDVGSHDGSPYLVAELLEGQTLRARLNGRPLAVRKALDYAAQIARGLAAAHDKGVVHRDLKPENLFVTGDGRVKILDFGLAKLVEGTITTDGPTLTAGTESGVVMGTVTYMSPEQARGERVDARSDIFAFGAILYEMLTGRAAFARGSKAETLSAILHDEPPAMEADTGAMAPGLDRIVRHCMEKRPEERFQSARDLAFDLEALSAPSGPTTAIPATPSRRYLVAALAAVLLAAAAFAAYSVGRRAGLAAGATPAFHQVTFRRGTVRSARFAPDGQSIVYSASWNGQPTRLFLARPGNQDAVPLDPPDADILSISSTGEMAILLGSERGGFWQSEGTLARVALGGGSPRPVLEHVLEADWSPDGKSLAVVHFVDGRCQLEFPIGTVLYETSGGISCLRVSPRGDRIAFVENPASTFDDAGSIATIDLGGNKTTLTHVDLQSVRGLAWSPSGNEVWFAGTPDTSKRALYAVTLSGQQREITRALGALSLEDIAVDGRALLTHGFEGNGLYCAAPGETNERDLSWFDLNTAIGLSTDGKTLLMEESEASTGLPYAIYLRATDASSPPVRLGEAPCDEALSPDGKRLVITRGPSCDELAVVPTGVGQETVLPRGPIATYSTDVQPAWLPDGRQVLFVASEQDHGRRLYRQDLDGGLPTPVTAGDIRNRPVRVSPDGTSVVAFDASRDAYILQPVEGGPSRSIPGLTADDQVQQWSADGRSLFVRGDRRKRMTAKIYTLDIATGRRQLWKELIAPDPAGVIFIGPIQITPDGSAYAYTYVRAVSDLYWVEGLR
jgi:Tol biopolymer transport system component